MSDTLVELEELREATRPRLAPKVTQALRDHADMYASVGNKHDRMIAGAITHLLDMHDRLEALRNA